MTVAEHLVVIGVALTMLVSWAAWLRFMLVMPRRWSTIIEWENSLWIRAGLLPESWAARLKAMETGTTLKVIVVLGIALSTAVLFKV
jgi:hypothetical protein